MLNMTSAVAMSIAIAFTGLSGYALADDAKNDTVVPNAAPLASPEIIHRLAVQPQNIGAGARLAIILRVAGSSAGTAFVKNVVSVTRAGTGIYCIRPSAAAALGSLTQIVPVVSVEWSTSAASASDALFAYYRQNRSSSCPSGTIEVDTWDGNHGSEVRSSGVSFTMIIP